MPDLAALARQDARTSRWLGVDFVPVYRGGGGPPAEQAPAGAIAEVKPRSQTVGVDDGVRRRKADALEAVRQRYLKDEPHRHFVTDHHSIVFGEGDPAARLMFIGEAPGAEEDRTGRPFVGRAGQLLDKMIIAMGLHREDVYICNVLKTRPPNNATPTLEEAARCAPYLFDQIAAIMPEVIVTLGLPASRLVLSSDESMTRLRGHWYEFRHPDVLQHPDLAIPVMPTFHPAFILRQYTPENRAKVWSDLQQVMERLGLKSPAKSAAT